MDADQRAARRTPTRACEIVDLVPAGARRVLDLGCSTGWLAGALKERGPVEVVGIEREPAYAAIARSAATASWSATSRTSERPRALRLPRRRRRARAPRRPWSALEGYAPLEPGCRAVVSLPNAAHWTTYAALARGSWPRRPEGIHDATHLRWFTLRDAIALCEGAGCGSSTSSAARGCCGAAPGSTATPARWRLSPFTSSTCSPRDGRRMARP